MLGDSAVVEAGRGPDPGCFDVPRPVHSRGMCSFRDVRSPRRTWTGEWRRERRGNAVAAFPALPCGLDLSLKLGLGTTGPGEV